MADNDPPPEAELDPSESQEQEDSSGGSSLQNAKNTFGQVNKIRNLTKGAQAVESAEAIGGAAEIAPVIASSAPAWPWILLGIAILLLLLLIFMLFNDQNNQEAMPVNITKEGPFEVSNDTSIEYQIQIDHAGEADDIIVRDPIPANTEFVAASPSARLLDASGAETTDLLLIKTVEWSLKDIQGPVPSTFSPQTLWLTVRPTSDDIYVVNQASVNVIGGIIDPNITPAEGYVPPNSNHCNDYYTNRIINNPLQKNFGDPLCTMLANLKPEDKNKHYDYLKNLDPSDAFMWHTVIIPQESGYNPNAFNGNAADDCGAWGMFQMNKASCVTHSTNPEEEIFLKYKHGDINWEIQTTNAINYGKNYRPYYEKYYNDGKPCPNAKWHFWQAADAFWECGTPWPQ